MTRKEHTKRICDEVKRSTVLLYYLSIQSSQIESVQYIVLVYLGKVLLFRVSGCDTNLKDEGNDTHIAFGVEEPRDPPKAHQFRTWNRQREDTYVLE